MGAPAKATRLMAGLHYLKYTFSLSDEMLVEAWVVASRLMENNPYDGHTLAETLTAVESVVAELRDQVAEFRTGFAQRR